MVESRGCFDKRKLNIAFLSRGVRALVGRFARDGRASLAISAALMMGAILGLAGLSIDVTLLSTLRSRVQAAVDAATVTGSRNLLDYVAVNGFGSVGRYYPTIQTQTVNAIQANLQLEKNLSNIVIGLPSVIYN
ncbi:TadE/TadG family type IV pilus assembly protein [Methylobacterium hispanicum]